MIAVVALLPLAFAVGGSPRSVRGSAFASRVAAAMGPPTVKSVLKDTDDRMSKSLAALGVGLGTIRTGRASPSMLDRINVDYFGAQTPLSQMASISTPTAQQLVVDAYDKTALKDIERALMEADLGMTPSNDGNLIRLNVPPLTEDRRKEFAKSAKAFGEDAKVALRNIRRDSIDAIKKMEKSADAPLGKDESADAQSKVDASVKKFTKTIDDTVAAKEKEIMKV